MAKMKFEVVYTVQPSMLKRAVTIEAESETNAIAEVKKKGFAGTVEIVSVKTLK